MNRALLDTDTLSEVLKGRDSTVLLKARAYRAQFGRYTLSTITVVEVVKGLHKARRNDRISQFVQALVAEEVLTPDLESAQVAGRIYADLERTGQPIGRIDPMIAAIAINHSLVLVSGNTNHYQRIQSLGYQLRIENWRE